MKKGIPELDKLFQEIGTYRKSSEFFELIEFVKKFPHIAPFNAMLVHVQKPGSQYVASASEWRNLFNRNIKPGARPLVILRPFGPVSFVFELSDTYGDDTFPAELLNPYQVGGEISDTQLRFLVSNLKCDGILYGEADRGASSAGFIQTNDNTDEMRIVKGNKELWLKVLFNMVVNRSHPKETKFTTILHELGHMYCGHLGTPNAKWWEARTDLDLDVCEFEAESVCWLVCERIGLKNPSAEYLSGYVKNNSQIPDVSIDAILKAAGIIETMIKSTKSPRKELILRTIELSKGK